MLQRPTNKAYITGGDINYMPLVEVMVKSLLEYAAEVNANIIVYTFNCDYQIEGVECKRITIPAVNYKQGLEFNIAKIDNSLFYAKFYATIDAFKQYEHVCWLDGDSFVLPGIKRIWEFDGDSRESSHPLFMHYLNRNLTFWRKNENKELRIEGNYGAEISRLFNVKRNPYKFLIATGLYITHRNHISFFEDILKKWELVKFSDCYVWADKHAFSEERLTNLKMWEMEAYIGLPITWVNLSIPHEPFNDFRLGSAIANGFDVMYLEDDMEPVMIHGPNPLVQEKTGENLKEAYDNFHIGADKLMIVAHPDDEMIFGGFDLLTEDNWKVICLTNQSDEKRREKFIKVLEQVGISEAYIYDLPDDMYKNLPQEEARNIIESHIKERNWKKIVTHNPIGEYGHPHHYQVYTIVKDITGNRKLWVFDKGERLPDDLLKRKRELLEIYDHEANFVEQIRTHNGRWFIEDDMTTNYIEHGRSTIYPNYSFGKYIPCFIK